MLSTTEIEYNTDVTNKLEKAFKTYNSLISNTLNIVHELREAKRVVNDILIRTNFYLEESFIEIHVNGKSPCKIIFKIDMKKEMIFIYLDTTIGHFVWQLDFQKASAKEDESRIIEEVKQCVSKILTQLCSLR